MLGLFNKKHAKVVNDADQIVHDFDLRAPFWSYRPLSYIPHQPFLLYQEEVDKFLDELLKSNAIDDGNGDVMTNLIDDQARIALADLERQKVSHEDFIESFDIRFRTDKEHFAEELSLMEDELKQVMEELNEITDRNRNEKFVKQKGMKK